MRADFIGHLMNIGFGTSSHLEGVLDDPKQTRDPRRVQHVLWTLRRTSRGRRPLRAEGDRSQRACAYDRRDKIRNQVQVGIVGRGPPTATADAKQLGQRCLRNEAPRPTGRPPVP
jgi:hypothetical protein